MAGPPLKILLVEDNPADAVSIEFLLGEIERQQQQRYRLKTADSISSGLKALDSETFDVVLLDFELPDSSGFDTPRRVQERAPEVPIVALTGHSDEEFAARAISMGVQDYLIKGRIVSDLLYRAVLYAIERKKSQQLLKNSEERFRAFFELTGVGAFQADPSGRFVLVNGSFCNIMGYDRDDLLSLSFGDLTHPDDLPGHLKEFELLLNGGQSQYDTEKRFVHKDGRTVWVHLSMTLLRDAKGRPLRAMGIVQDITGKKSAEEEIKHIADHDALTGLPNRRLFIELTRLEVAQARRNRKKIAFLFLDLDRFKNVNDTLGHGAGDEMLMEVAYRIRRNLRKSDTVARVGGDEFNIILPDIARGEDGSEIASKLVASFQAPFFIAGHELRMTASIGISVYPDDDEDMDTLFRYADIAMYYAKKQGRNAFQFYNPAINTRSIERMQMEGWLRRCVERDELSVHYQPQLEIKTGKIISAESLVRWNHPERGLLQPKSFVPLAEETGLIAAIDLWVLNAVCRQVRTWLDAGFPPFSITVNLSARLFQDPELVVKISKILKDTAFPADCLGLEITESVAMSNIEYTAEQLGKLAEMGMHILIDDFGTGYSSLNYLKRLPIGRLKIDRTFIEDIRTDPDDRAIINAVTAMAHNLRMKVIAEGVETEDQLEFLRGAGCDEIQGYLVSKPLPAEEFSKLIASGKFSACPKVG